MRLFSWLAEILLRSLQRFFGGSSSLVGALRAAKRSLYGPSSEVPGWVPWAGLVVALVGVVLTVVLR